MSSRFAIIDNGIVVNLVKADVDSALGKGWILAEGAAIGDKWDGSAFISPDAPPIVITIPYSVTRFQAKAALLEAGHLAAVDALMASQGTPQIYKLAWAEALTFERTSATVEAMGASLGLSDSDIDALFIAASEISA